MTPAEFDAMMSEYDLVPLGSTAWETAQRGRQQVWRPLRRLMLECGVTAEQYAQNRAMWRLWIAVWIARHSPAAVYRLAPKAVR